MKIKLLYFSSLFFLMLITGVFWGTWFTLTRSIENFSSDEFIHIGKVIIANVAVPMSMIMPVGIVLVALSTWNYPGKKTAGFYLALISLGLLVAVLVITLLVLVPIDDDIQQWSTLNLPDNWHEVRGNWKFFHAIRTLVSVISFACFSLAVISAKKRKRIFSSALAYSL